MKDLTVEQLRTYVDDPDTIVRVWIVPQEGMEPSLVELIRGAEGTLCLMVMGEGLTAQPEEFLEVLVDMNPSFKIYRNIEVPEAIDAEASTEVVASD